MLKMMNPLQATIPMSQRQSNGRDQAMNLGFVGIWIDHESAQVVNVAANGDATSTTFEARAERRRRLSERPAAQSPLNHTIHADNHDRNRRSGLFDRFYDRVISSLPPCAGIVIMGPGFAKRELWNRIKEDEVRAALVLSVQTTPKLLVPQIAERVREVAASRLENHDPPRAGISIPGTRLRRSL